MNSPKPDEDGSNHRPQLGRILAGPTLFLAWLVPPRNNSKTHN